MEYYTACTTNNSAAAKTIDTAKSNYQKSVPEGPLIANTELEGDHISLKTIRDGLVNISDPKMRTALTNALIDLAMSGESLGTVAKRNSINPTTLSQWAMKLGIGKRKRGRPFLTSPTSTHQRICELAREHGVAEAARRLELSRQRVHSIIRRWQPELLGRRKPTSKKRCAPTSHREPRRIVVSFRFSDSEWQRLLDTPLAGTPNKLSGRKKARAILLKYIVPPNAHGNSILPVQPNATASKSVNQPD